ncbi:MAG: DUF6807 family protein [Planctomycetota bacterium]
MSADIPGDCWMRTLISIIWFVAAQVLCAQSFCAQEAVKSDEGAEQEAGRRMLECRQTEKAIQVVCNGTVILHYNVAPRPAPTAELGRYERSGYLHPIRTMGGSVVTGDFAPDHPHQHGLFTAWVNTRFAGRKVDFWNQHKKTGIVLHDEVLEIFDEDKRSGFRVALQHSALSPDGEMTPVLRDVWTVLVSEPVDRDAKEYEIDFAFKQLNISDEDLQIAEYHYGGFGFRGRNDWYSEQVKGSTEPLPYRFLTSDGKGREDGNHTRPDWVMLSGNAERGRVGVRLSGDQSNSGHPHPVRLHPSKPYFSVTPCYLNAITIKPGETYQARYLIRVFEE